MLSMIAGSEYAQVTMVVMVRVQRHEYGIQEAIIGDAGVEVKRETMAAARAMVRVQRCEYGVKENIISDAGVKVKGEARAAARATVRVEAKV
jgi:ribosomal protein S11